MCFLFGWFYLQKIHLKKKPHFRTILAHIPVIFLGGPHGFFGPEIPRLVAETTPEKNIPSQEEAERLAQLRAAKVAQANASKKAEEKAKEWSKGWCKGLKIV